MTKIGERRTVQIEKEKRDDSSHEQQYESDLERNPVKRKNE